jgi:HAD superfamily hydrolase (TIGR01509 family)
VIDAVVFDLDGVLLDSEQVWDEAREQLAKERGGRWHPQAQRDMMGMSSTEWSRYMHETIGLPEPPEQINREVVERLAAIYREHLPAIPGSREAVERLAARWPLGLASSSNRELIDLALELLGVKHLFAATVSSEEVARGKPAPDVYLEAARRLAVEPIHAARSRTRTTASSPRRPRACACSRSRTATSRLIPRPLSRPTSCSTPSPS